MVGTLFSGELGRGPNGEDLGAARESAQAGQVDMEVVFREGFLLGIELGRGIAMEVKEVHIRS